MKTIQLRKNEYEMQLNDLLSTINNLNSENDSKFISEIKDYIWTSYLRIDEKGYECEWAKETIEKVEKNLIKKFK